MSREKLTSAQIRICQNVINTIDDKSWKLKMHLAVHRSRTVHQNLGEQENSKMPRVQLTTPRVRHGEEISSRESIIL